MDKNSNKPCENLNGLKYKISSITSKALTIQNTLTNGTSEGEAITVNVDSAVASILASVTLPTVTNNTSEGSVTSAQYNFIKNLTLAIKNYIPKDVRLINIVEYSQSKSNLINLQKQFVELTSNIRSKVKNAKEGCEYFSIFSNWSQVGGCVDDRINGDEYSEIKDWANSISQALNNADLNVYTKQELADIFASSLTNHLINILRDDEYNSTSCCKYLNQQIASISSKYSVTINLVRTCD